MFAPDFCITFSLNMPLAVIGDIFLGNSVKVQVVFGAIVVTASFVVVGMEDS